ncbi:DegT/DnrJ/EryC1/StrS family aminotransferase [candidate division KSB1 bacterium]
MSTLFDDQIPITKPNLGLEEWESIKDVILSGWVSQGQKAAEFEDSVASFVGAKYAVAANSCTSALHLALKIHNIGSGDEVILPDSTCMADANAIILSGASPVFVDVDEKTYNIDPQKTEDAISSKTKALMAVAQNGMSADLDSFRSIADKHNLVLIDDSATALGAEYKGKRLGSHGITAAFSFHPRKMITTGEGGIIVTDNKELADRARELRSHGASVSDMERHKAKGTIVQQYFVNGYNYRFTDIQAAIGLIQMSKLDTFINKRREQAVFYNNAFKDIEELEIPFVPENCYHVYSSYPLKINSIAKFTPKDILEKLSEKNISCRFGITPLHQEPYFSSQNLADRDFPGSCLVSKHTFYIPIFPDLSKKELVYIKDSILEFVDDLRKNR